MTGRGGAADAAGQGSAARDRAPATRGSLGEIHDAAERTYRLSVKARAGRAHSVLLPSRRPQTCLGIVLLEPAELIGDIDRPLADLTGQRPD